MYKRQSHHGSNQAHLCQITYEGLDQENMTMVESMCQGGRIHAMFDLSHLKSKFYALENMIKGLVSHKSPPSQTPDMCSQCNALDHTLRTCPYFTHQLASNQEQVNMAYQRPKNDPYAPSFNPRWHNHPNLS